MSLHSGRTFCSERLYPFISAVRARWSLCALFHAAAAKNHEIELSGLSTAVVKTESSSSSEM